MLHRLEAPQRSKRPMPLAPRAKQDATIAPPHLLPPTHIIVPKSASVKHEREREEGKSANQPFVDVAEGAAADEVAAAEPRLDGGGHGRGVRHPKICTPAAAAASSRRG